MSIQLKTLIWIISLALPPIQSIHAQEPACEVVAIEIPINSHQAVVRSFGGAYQQCFISEESLYNAIREVLNKQPKREPPFRSVYMGRAISYPWLVNHLIEASSVSPDWDARKGGSLTVGDNRFVSRLLSQPNFLKRIQAPFENSIYQVMSVAVEKVLIGDPSTIDKNLPARGLKVPFDAQLWLVLDVKQRMTDTNR